MQKENKEYVKQIIRYAIYLVIVLGLTVLAFYLTIGNNAAAIDETLQNANIWWIVAILGVVIACILLRSIVVFALMRTYYKKYFFHRAIAIDQVGTLFRMVTPAGLGSHIMELYTFKKQHISISDGLSVLALYSLLYQFVLIIYNSITIIVKAPLVIEIGSINFAFNDSIQANIPLWLLITIGFIVNLTVITFIFFISYWDGFYRLLNGPIARFLHKIKLVKDIDAYQYKLAGAKDNFRNNFKYLFKNWKVMLISLVAFFGYITISYSVPYFAGLAINNQSANANFWDSVLLSNFHQMITCLFPIPGNSMISELFFLRLFYSSNPAYSFYQSEEIARAALLLWRSLMFIFPLFISSLFTIIYRPRKVDPDASNQENQDIKE
ncbi:MAG: flippase-like domain-containing protein [Bacilli bacterium]|nr:flippase-like domain-containing protein [Bacilli bacterium]